jgi:hypothetical protein
LYYVEVKIFLALSGAPTSLGPLNQLQYPYVLNSFAYSKALDKLTYRPKDLTLDSGAFTAWNSGKSVDIVEYAEWCLQWQAKNPSLRAVNLDVIPGEAGRTSTPQERKLGMEQSLKNADYLRGRGISIEEVFHQDEPYEFLDHLVSRLPKGDVLCISPRNDVSKKKRLLWLQNTLSHLVKTVGRDNLPKMHGLAVTSKDLMLAFPFYSADSSTYSTPARFGVTFDHDGTIIRTEDFLGRVVRSSDRGAMRQMINQSIDYYKKIKKRILS